MTRTTLILLLAAAGLGSGGCNSIESQGDELPSAAQLADDHYYDPWGPYQLPGSETRPRHSMH